MGWRKWIKKVALSVMVAVIVTGVSWFMVTRGDRKALPPFPGSSDISVTVKRNVRKFYRATWLLPSAGNAGELGKAFHSNGLYDEALDCYWLASKKGKSAWEWEYYSGYINLERGNSDSAIQNFLAVTELDPGNKMALFYLGDAFMGQGATQKAEKAFREVIRLAEEDTVQRKFTGNYFPEYAYAGFRLARIYLNSGRIDSAVSLLSELTGKQKKFGPAFRLLGNAYNQSGDLLLADRYLLMAGDRDEYTPPFDTLISKLVYNSGSEPLVLKYIDDALNCGNTDFAIRLCSQAIENIPDSRLILSKTINGYFALGFDDRALKYLDDHFISFSEDFRELISMAGVLAEKGYRSQAMKYFGQAKILQPDNSRLALWLSDRGMRDESLLLLHRQMTENPENTEILSDAVKLTIRLENFELARDFLSRLDKLSPGTCQTLKLHGVLEELTGRVDVATDYFRKAYLSDTTDLEIVIYLSKVYRRDEMWRDLARHYKESLETFPNEPALLAGYGDLLVNCPDKSVVDLPEGVWYAERAYYNYMSNFQVLLESGKTLVEGYYKMGQKTKAMSYLDETMKLASRGMVSPDFYYELDRLKNLLNADE